MPVQYCIVVEISWKLHCQVGLTGTDLVIPIAGDVQEMEELKNLVNWVNTHTNTYV